MKVFRDYVDIDGLAPSVTAIGNFDGVHLGHQALLNKAKACAKGLEIETAVLTFDPHPSHVVAPNRGFESLISLEDRVALLGDRGVDKILAQRFDLDFAALSPKAFVKEVLVDALNVRAVVVGFNFGLALAERVALMI